MNRIKVLLIALLAAVGLLSVPVASFADGQSHGSTATKFAAKPKVTPSIVPSNQYFLYGETYCDHPDVSYSCYIDTSGFHLYSSNGRDVLGFQSDGNWVGRVRSTGAVWFETNTKYNYNGWLVFDPDCNIVVLDSTGGYVKWSAGVSVAGAKRCRLTLGGDGRFSIWSYNEYYGTWVRVKSFGTGP